MYKEKIIKRKRVNLHMRKDEPTGCKVLKQLLHVLNSWVCASLPYIENWNWLKKFDFIVYFWQNSVDVL